MAITQIRKILDEPKAIEESSGTGTGFKVGDPYPRVPIKHKDEVVEEIEDDVDEDDKEN